MAQFTVQIRMGAPTPFSPAAVQISQGDTVHWINNDPIVHTATADNGEFDSGDIASAGGTFDWVCQVSPRTIQYGCTYHPGMRGTIVVT